MASVKEKENREAEIVSLKTKLQMKYISKSYENNSKIIEHIIINQNPFSEKTGIGYNKNVDEASISMTIGKEEKTRSYAEVFKESTNEKRSNSNQNNPYQKEGQQKDKISEEQLLHLLPCMDISFMGIALLVEYLDTRL